MRGVSTCSSVFVLLSACVVTSAITLVKDPIEQWSFNTSHSKLEKVEHKEPQLIQRLNLSYKPNIAASLKDYKGSPTYRYLVKSNMIQLLILGMFPLFFIAGVELVRLIWHAPSRFLPRFAESPHMVSIRNALDISITASVIALDNAIAAITIPLLPDLSRGHGTVLLYCVRPIISTTMVILLPLLLRRGVNRGRFVIGIGLSTLSISCLIFSKSSSYLAAMVARSTSAMASAMIVVPIFHTLILNAPRNLTGWRIDAAMANAVISFTFGPWIGSMLNQFFILEDMMLVFSSIAAVVACMHVFMTKWIMELPADHHRTYDTQKSVFRAVYELVHDAKMCTLLAGLALCSSVLALHGTLVPAYLANLHESSLTIVQGVAGVMLGLTILLCGTCIDRLGEPWVIRGMLVALITAILGLRSIAMEQNIVHPLIISIGLLASYGGIGGFLGLALPMLVQRTCEYNAFPAPPAVAVTSAAFGIMWFLGDGMGVWFQLALYPLLGYSYTILAFAAILAVYTAMILIVPGWIRKGSHRMEKKLKDEASPQEHTHMSPN